MPPWLHTLPLLAPPTKPIVLDGSSDSSEDEGRNGEEEGEGGVGDCKWVPCAGVLCVSVLHAGVLCAGVLCAGVLCAGLLWLLDT